MTERDPSNAPDTDAAAQPSGSGRAGIDSLLADINALCGGTPIAPPPGKAAGDDPFAALLMKLEAVAPSAATPDLEPTVQPAPGEPAPGEPAPGEPALGEPALGEPAPGEPAPGEPAPGEPAPSEPAAALDSGPSESASARTESPGGPAADTLPSRDAPQAQNSVSGEPPAREAAPALQSLDGALASDVEDLLGGNFETVSAVLGDASDAGTSLDRPGGAGGSEAPLGAHTDLELPEDTISFSPPEGGDTPGSEPLPSATPADGGPLPARANAAEAPALANEPAATEPAAPPEPIASEPDAPSESPPDTPASPPGRLVSIWIRAEPIVVDTLRIANRPLRRVPAQMRPVVDWIALSLVFWVPIVWVVALFVVG